MCRWPPAVATLKRLFMFWRGSSSGMWPQFCTSRDDRQMPPVKPASGSGARRKTRSCQSNFKEKFKLIVCRLPPGLRKPSFPLSSNDFFCFNFFSFEIISDLQKVVKTVQRIFIYFYPELSNVNILPHLLYYSFLFFLGRYHSLFIFIFFFFFLFVFFPWPFIPLIPPSTPAIITLMSMGPWVLFPFCSIPLPLNPS